MGSDHSGLLPEDGTASVLGHTHCRPRRVSGTSSYRVISWEGWDQHQIPQCWLGACLLSPQTRQVKSYVSGDLTRVSRGTGKGTPGLSRFEGHLGAEKLGVAFSLNLNVA